VAHHLAIYIEKDFRREEVGRVLFVKRRDQLLGRPINVSSGAIDFLIWERFFFAISIDFEINFLASSPITYP